MSLPQPALAPRMLRPATTSGIEHSASRMADAIAALLVPDPGNGTAPDSGSEEIDELRRQITAPLRVASGYAEALGRDLLAMTSDRVKVDMARIIASTRKTRSLLDGLLAIVRLKRKGPRASRSYVDPCEMLHEAVRRNTPLLLDKSLAFGASTQGLPVIRMDRSAVDSIIDNLVAALVPRLNCGSQIWAALQCEPTGLALRLTIEPPEARPGTPEATPRPMGKERDLACLVATRITELLGGRLETGELTETNRTWRVLLPV